MKTKFRQISKVLAVALVALAMLGLQSCYKRDYTTTSNGNTFDNSKTVTSSIYGIVHDEAGMPVEGATVKTSGYTTLTDDNGLFFFNNITTPSRASTVVVSKAGYFNGSRTLSVKANDKHTVHVSLMAKGTPETFYANNGGTVNFAGGISISFPANAIVNKASGAPYNGQVFVYAKNIDPTTDLGMNTMPGDLRGIGASGDERMLQSYGMLVAELYDMNGNALQIGNTSSATLSQTIPASLQGMAKTSIPLWYYDEAQGMWIEEGSAAKVGNRYEGKVRHFTYWNFDLQVPSINMEMTFQDQNGNPLSGYYVSLHNANNQGAHGYTSVNGWVGGLAEANAVLTLNVYANNICGFNMPIYTTTITTGAVNQNLGIITVTIAGGCSMNATIQDCLGAPVSNGALYIPQLNMILTPNALGEVSFASACTPNGPITLLAYDFANNVYGSSSYTLAPGVNNIGILSACGNIAPFLTVNLTNTVSMVSASNTFVLPGDNLNCSLQGPNTYINAYGAGGGVNLIIDGITTGTFNVSSGNAYLTGAFADSLVLTGVNSATFTSFPAFPGAVEGTYSLNFVGSPSGDTYTATGSFRIPRSN